MLFQAYVTPRILVSQVVSGTTWEQRLTSTDFNAPAREGGAQVGVGGGLGWLGAGLVEEFLLEAA